MDRVSHFLFMTYLTVFAIRLLHSILIFTEADFNPLSIDLTLNQINLVLIAMLLHLIFEMRSVRLHLTTPFEDQFQIKFIQSRRGKIIALMVLIVQAVIGSILSALSVERVTYNIKSFDIFEVFALVLRIGSMTYIFSILISDILFFKNLSS